jgi:serine-type D-Ala-D-Ala carboxypeptidase/endopeptidase
MQILKIIGVIISVILVILVGFYTYIKYRNNHIKDTFNLEQKIEKIIEKELIKNKRHGIVIGVVKNNSIFIKGFGVKDTIKNEKPDRTTLFELASIGKLFTTSMVQIAVNRKEMVWNQTIAACLESKVKIPNNYQATLLNLATHTSGLPSLPKNMLDKMNDEQNLYKELVTQDIYDYLKISGENTSIGEYEYSNFGMGLLGHIIELKYNGKYEDIIKKEICNKLEMRNTTMNLNSEQAKNVAQGYDENGKPNPIWQDNVLTGAGSFLSNADDMTKFISANLSANYNEISPPLIQCHKPQLTGETGLGWHMSNTWFDDLFGLKGIIWHNGGAGGYSSYIAIDYASKSGIIILSNDAKDITTLGVNLMQFVKNVSFSKIK